MIFICNRFKISSEYGMSGCAMVNVRDLAGIANAWKLLVAPDPRLFQCKDNQSKKVSLGFIYIFLIV